MDLKRLEQFVAVARHGSFGRAAAALDTTQPALTRGVRSLEAEVGTALFDRGPRGAVLTAAGEKFLPRAQSLVHDMHRALVELEPSRAQERAQVRIGVSPDFLHWKLPEILAEALRRSPELNVQVSTGTSEMLRQQLRSREIDLSLHIVAAFPLAPSEEAQDLDVELIGQARILPYAPAGDPAGAGRPGLEALAQRRWAVPYQLSLLYRFESAFRRTRLAVPVQALNGAALPLIAEVMHGARLLAMLPESFAAPAVAAGGLAPVDCAELAFDYAVALITARGRAAPASLDLARAIRAALA